MQVAITSITIPNWRFGGATAKLRIVSNDNFFNSGGVQILRGSAASNSFYKEINCTVSGDTLTCPSFSIDSTTDSSVPTATYTAYLYDAKNTKRAEYLANFKVPHTLGANVSWLAINAYLRTRTRTLPSTYYTAEQVNSLLSGNASITGYTTANTLTLRSLDRNNITTAQIADVLATLINDLMGGGGGGTVNTTPLAPTLPVTDDSADTFNWTNNLSFTALADYEFTVNAGFTYAPVTAKPVVVGNVALAPGSVGVRVKAATGRNVSGTLYNTTAFTSSAPADTTAPPTVTGLTATPVSTSQINLAWTPVTDSSGILRYDIQYATDVGFTAPVSVSATGAVGTLSVTGLAASTLYYFRVKAVDNAGNLSAAWSTAASATTSATGTITTPAQPSAPVTDDTANTFNWTDTPGFTALTDYEFTLDGGASYTPVTAKPSVVGNVAKAIGQVGVRVKAAPGRNVSATLYNAVAFTVSGAVGSPLTFNNGEAITSGGEAITH